MALAMVFPGQGSQSQGMQADLAAEYADVGETYAEASEVLGYDLWQLVADGPAERLAETSITQPAMLTAGLAAWRVWLRRGGTEPNQLAGHSLGEYTALVCGGAMGFADAMRVVKQRAQLMQNAVPVGAGAMAAIIGLDDAAVIDVCGEAARDGVAEAVNFNAPGQVVIAGDAEAIDRAIALAGDRGARRALKLPVSVPAHSQLMRDAGEALREALAAAAIESPAIRVVAASNAEPYIDGDDIRERLAAQVYAPVQWVAAVEALAAAGGTEIVECGPGKVLAGLIRRIDKSLSIGTLDSLDGLEKALALTTTG